MNNNMPPPPPPPYQKSHPQSSFPQDLPPRNLRQTWWQRNGFKSKPFFTLYVLNKSTHPYLNNTPHLRPLAKLTPVRRHYHSFSLRNHHGAREIWRRVSMWIIMLVRLIQVILLATLSIAGVYWSGPGYIVLIVFLALIALGLLLVSAWNLALIGDAAGTRRAMGVVVVSLRRSVPEVTKGEGWMNSLT